MQRPRPRSRLSIAHALLVLGWVPGFAEAEEPWTERQVIARYLSSEEVRHQLDAADAQSRAAATAPPLLANPSLNASLEQEPGGAQFSRLGGSVAIDLGLPQVPRTTRARMLRATSATRRDLVRLAAACRLRQHVLRYWSAEQTAETTREAQVRLDELTSRLEALAEAGERAGFEVERARLAARVHAIEVLVAQSAVDEQRARLELFLGPEVPRIVLDALPSLDRLERYTSAAEEHPELRFASASTEAARLSEVATRREAVPDLRVQAGAAWSPGVAETGYLIGANLELPLFDWSQSSLREARSSTVAATLSESTRRLEIRSQVSAAWHRASALSVELQTTNSAALWESAVVRYRAGEEAIGSLLQLATEVEQERHATLRLETLRRRAMVDLDCAAGRYPGSTP